MEKYFFYNVREGDCLSTVYKSDYLINIYGREKMILEINTCTESSSLREAMRKIEQNGIGALFVVDKSDKLCGVLTDGDIRRGLLEGYGLNDNISSILKDEYVYVTQHDDPEEIVSKFSRSVRVLPVIDNDKHLVDYYEFNENISSPLAMPQLSGNEYRYLMEAFLSSWISSSGKYIEMFEGGFSTFCGMKYGVATSNGTTALHLALVSLNIGKGDEVIVPNLTFAATINSVLYTGATPVIVDIESDSWCMDPQKMREAVTCRTKAVIPVHIYGQPCNMDEICRIANEHDIYVVEDCAEAHGAKWNGKRVGSCGIISCFSFYGNKVITTGEGGMCLTNDSRLNARMRLLRDHGMNRQKRYYHEVIGFNYRMTNMQAAIGTAQVEHIEDILRWRKALEDLYRTRFKDDRRVEMQHNDLEYREKITWLVSVLVNDDKRDMVIDELKKNGIDARPFFVPLGDMPLYQKYIRVDCPISREISKRGINLPTTYEVKDSTVERIVTIFGGVL